MFDAAFSEQLSNEIGIIKKSQSMNNRYMTSLDLVF